MVIYIKKVICFIILFVLFNLNHIDSNSDKRIIYNTDDIYNKSYYSIYFVNTTIEELTEVLSILDIDVLSYVINDKKYYARNISVLESNYIKDKSESEIIYLSQYGIKVDKINVICSVNEILKLENMVDIY